MTPADRTRTLPPFRQCFNCNFEAQTVEERCPRCRNNKFFTSQNIRTRGIVLVIIGIFLVVFMAGIAAFVGMLLLGASGNAETARKLNEGAMTLIAISALFAAIIGFGFNSIAGGAWMIVTGRRNRIMVWLMWTLIAVIFIGGNAIRYFLT